MRNRPAVLPVTALLLSCTGHTRVSTPVQRLIPRGPDARIEVLDWNGPGTPVLLLPGLGNTAHVFEDFAPRLADARRVLALTPRGFGASSPNDRGVPLDTVLADVAAALDSLGISRVVLAGNSLGGDVATFFAVRHPDRVIAVFYLDGAEDRRPGAQPPPPASWPAPPAMTSADSASDRAYQRYIERVYRPRLPLADIHATTLFDAQGRIAGDRSAAAVTAVLVGSLSPAPFDRVTVPVLAIFPEPDSLQYDMPYWNELSGPARAAADSLQRWLITSSRENEDSIRRMMPQAEVVRIPHSGHLIFLLSPDETANAIRRFLAKATPQGAGRELP